MSYYDRYDDRNREANRRGERDASYGYRSHKYDYDWGTERRSAYEEGYEREARRIEEQREERRREEEREERRAAERREHEREMYLQQERDYYEQQQREYEEEMRWLYYCDDESIFEYVDLCGSLVTGL